MPGGSMPPIFLDISSSALRWASLSAATKKTELREQALADAGVQALLDVFPAEIRDVEEM